MHSQVSIRAPDTCTPTSAPRDGTSGERETRCVLGWPIGAGADPGGSAQLPNSPHTRRLPPARRLAAWEQQSRRGRGWEDGVAWASLAATREVSPVPCTAGRREGRNQGEPRLSPPWVGLQSDVRPLGGVRLRPGTAEGSASAEAGGGEAHVAAHREDTGAVGPVSVEARRAGERRCIRLIYDTMMKAGPSGGRGGSTRVSFQSPGSPGSCAKPVSTHGPPGGSTSR